MGNLNEKMSSSGSSLFKYSTKKWEPVENFKFHENFLEETNNGLYFNDIYLPEELVAAILSYIDPKHILKATLVCKKWCNIIKSDTFWCAIYFRHYNKKPKKLPWYVYYCLFTTSYFDRNLLKNGNGQDKFKHWKIVVNGGDGFTIENPPVGADTLPLDVPEFNGKTSCFATSYGECDKFQEISLERNRLLQFILCNYKPHIYLSEWVAARFDCGCVYTMWCKLLAESSNNDIENRDISESDLEEFDNDGELFKPVHVQKVRTTFEQWTGSKWQKIELLVKDYPEGVKKIIFQHQGHDMQFWKGHYGSKMAGGVVKILFDSIEAPADYNLDI